MRRSSLVLILFFVLIGAILGYNTYLQRQPPLTLIIATDPSAGAWANRLAEAFNARGVQTPNGTRIQIVIDATTSDIRVWQGSVEWTGDNHPEAWLSTTSLLTNKLPSNLLFTVLEPSLASSPLMWGGFASRVNILTDNLTNPFDWSAAQAAAAGERWDDLGAPTEWGFVNVGIPWPRSSAAGLITMLSLVGDYSQSVSPSATLFTDSGFRTWFAPLKQAMRSSERLGETPPGAMASRGANLAGFAIAPEFEWLTHLDNLTRQEPVVLAYPAYNLALDFPLLLWQDSKTIPDEQQGIRAFADFVKSGEGQAITLQAGLRPLGVTPDTDDKVFADATAYGLLLTLTETPWMVDPSVLEQSFRLMD